MRGSRRAHSGQQAMQVRLLGTYALHVLHVSPPRHLPLHLCVCVRERERETKPLSDIIDLIPLALRHL